MRLKLSVNLNKLQFILRKTVLSNRQHSSTMRNIHSLLLKTVSLAMYTKITYQRYYSYYEVFYQKLKINNL